MPKGDKYHRLTEYLKKNGKDSILLSFEDIERITGGLPPSVYKYSTAWSDKSGHSFSYGWLRAGYSIQANIMNQEALFIKVDNLESKVNIKYHRIENRKRIKKMYKKVTIEEINKASHSVENDSVYGNEGVIVDSIIRRFPDHDSIENTIIKLCIIDVTHSTQIFKQKRNATIVQLAQAINNIPNIDTRLKTGDINLVTEIAKSTKVGFLSIASKYCACHNQALYNKDDYFKFDSVVSSQINYTGRDYLEYYNLLETIIDDNHLRNVPGVRKKLDHFFWYNNRVKK